MASNYLKQSRHGSTFYFRRRVPDDLRPVVGRPYLIKTLRTGKRRDAIILARALAARTDSLFHHLRIMPNHDDKIQVDLIFELDFNDLGGLKSVHIEADTPEEQEQAKTMLDSALDKLLANRDAPTAIKGNGKSIVEAWEAYKAEKIATKAWKDGEDTAKYDHWPHIRAFIELIGNKPISTITAEDAERFQHHILTENPGESARNKDKRLTRAGALFRWAKGKPTWGITADFGKLFQFPDKKKILKNSYLKYEPADLAVLFESNDYKERQFKTPSEYWLPVLALFTGARLNELCQLIPSDIGTHDDVNTISILDEEIGKRLKTTASRRIIPIHSKLVEMGFLEYVTSIKSGRIFPELPESKQRPGDFSKEPGRKFTNYRRRIGIGGDNLNPDNGKWEGNNRKIFHSFRTTLISALRKANVPKDRRTRLAGHEYDDTQDKEYDGGDVLTMFDFSTLRDDIETVRYDVAFTPYRSNF